MISISSIINGLVEEHHYQIFYVPEFQITEDLYIQLTLATKDHFEYLIFTDIDFNSLPLVNDTVQIALYQKLNRHLEILNKKTGSDFILSHYFENNTSLIISTEVPLLADKNEIFKSVSAVEENSFYFKKQVIYFALPELECFGYKDSEVNSISEYCGHIVSDLNRYKQFTESRDAEYEFIVKLYEKLPFLNLSVSEQDTLNIDEMIKDALTEEESILLSELLLLDDDEKRENWIELQGKDND